MGTSQHKVVRVVGRAERPAVRRQRKVAMILAVIVGFVLATAPVSFAEEAPPDAVVETAGGDAGSVEAATPPEPEPTPTTVAPEPKPEPEPAASTDATPEPAASTDTTPTTAAPDETTSDTTVPATEPDQRPTGDIGVQAAAEPGPAPTVEPVVTKRDGVNGCNGARPTPGSENTNKRLIGGTLEPGGTAIFEISYPVDPADATGRTTFEILDCVFINDVAVLSYDISIVPNTANYIFRFSLDIPVNAPIGAPYCNVAKTTAAPSTSQASNRKAGPACFIIGGDLRILKVDVSGGSLSGATFSVSCTPPDAPEGTVLPPIIIEGVDQDAMPPTVIADGIITIAGPQGTECVVTETAAPPGYALPNPNFVTVTIGVDGPTIRFVNVIAGSPNLRIVKTADAAVVSAGSQIGFGITVTNVGDAAATSVTLSDPLPAGTGINWSIGPAAYTGPGTCAITGTAPQTLNCSFGNMAPGATATVHVVSATTGDTSGIFRNVATAQATNHPPVSDDATVTVLQPSLTIVKTADATSVSAGTDIGFGITVANAFGAGTATAVTLSDPLPAGAGIDWSINPAYTGPGTCAITGLVGSETLNCTFGNLAPGASVTVHVTSPTTADTSGTFLNTATASSTNHPPVIDDAVVVVNKPALSIVKTADATSVNSGSNIGFGITVSNSGAAGTGTATAVTLSDPLPSGTGISWSISPAYTGPGTCSITGTAPTQTLNCSFGDLAPGASATVNVLSATTSATSGTFRNVATASSTNHPPVIDDAVVVVNKPNLTIAKTADSETVNSGSPIGFTVTVANAGPGTATAVTLADPLPAGAGINWSISPAYIGPGTCAVTGAVGTQTLNCTFGDLASGALVAVHVSSPTTSATSGTFLNTATASSTNHPPVTDDARVVVNKPNLSIVKTADATSVNSGSPIGFTVTVANAGPGTATAVVLNDPLPPAAGVSWSISPSTAGCSISGTAPTQVLNCTFGDLASGASASVHVVSNTTFATSGTLLNTATVSAGNHPPVVDDAQVVINRPGLSVTKLADAPSVSSGSPIGFTVTVSNAGPGTAINVVLNDPLPSGTGINWSISPPREGCSITGAVGSQVLSCTFGDMATGASASVHVTSPTTAATSGTFTNTATASADNHPPVTGIANVIVNKPNLTVTKTADAASVSSGSPIGFTVTVANAGPGTATGVTLSDPLPAATGVSWSISPAQAGCAITGTAPTQTLNCTFGDLASGASASVHVISATTAATTGTLTNTATAQAANHPPVTGVASVVVNKPNLSVTKTADAASVIAGNPIGFTVTVSNAGPGAATNLTVSDPLPGGTGIDWSISPATAGCSITGAAPTQTLTCTVASLASGASLVVHVVSQTTAASVGTFENVATAKADNNPEVKANATTSVVAPPIVLGTIIERAAPAIIEPAPAPPPPPAPAPAAVAAATLPRTGTDPLTLVFSGLLLIAAGFGFRRWGRRA